MHYILAGTGPDVVLIHGLLGNLSVWHFRVVPAFRQGFRVTTYDLRGHGYSEVTARGYSARAMAGDLITLLDSLGIPSAALVGYSFGADIALYTALEQPERVSRVVALEPGLAALSAERAKPEWPGWKHLIARLEASGVRVPQQRRFDVQYLLEQSFLSHDPQFKGLARQRELQARLVRETSLMREYLNIDALTLDALREIHAPVLLAFGMDSPLMSSYEPIATRLPNCQSLLLPDLDHFSMLEMPEALLSPIFEFLRKPQTARAGEGDWLAATTGC